MKTELLDREGKLVVYPSICELPKNFGVAVIDMQLRYVKGIDPERLEKMVTAQLDVLRICTRRNIPTFLVHYHDNKGEYEILRELVDATSGNPNRRLVKKEDDDAFKKTNLNGYMTEMGVDCLCLMGVNASACVRSTACGALSLKKQIISAEDLIADRVSLSAWFLTDTPHNGIYIRNGLEFYARNALAFFEEYKDLVRMMES